MKKVLIPTLRFPPAGGVGLRRMIKMGKKLAENGVKVHFITTNNVSQVNSYVGDINNNNIVVKKIPSLSLNNYLNRDKCNIVDKIVTKIVYYITLPLFFVDYAMLWGVILIPYVYGYLKKENIKNIYVSGPAFSTVFHMAVLKFFLREDIKLICEWRDYWTDDYEREYLPPKQITKGMQVWMENFSLSRSDCVISVTGSLLDSLVRGNDSRKYKLIENGFDSDDFENDVTNATDNLKKDNIVICYTGNIVDTRAEGLYAFLEVLRTCDDVRLEICGQLGFWVEKHIKKYYDDLLEKNVIIYHGVISVKDSIKLLNKSDVCLVLIQRQHPEALTSKFFEYCYARKKIIAIGPKGDLSDKMSQLNIGLYCDLDDFDVEKLKKYIYIGDELKADFSKVVKYNDYTYLADLLNQELN